MKILNSPAISSFGGINFVLEELINLEIGRILDTTLPKLPSQSKYNWQDLIFSYWSIYIKSSFLFDVITIIQYLFFNVEALV